MSTGLRNAVAAIIALAAALVAVGLIRDWHIGGNDWKQGDWLINFAAGPVRRGSLGTLLIALADRLAVSPLTVTVGLQLALLGLLTAATLRLAWRLCVHPPLAVLFASPAFWPLFWASDLQGSARKELIAFAALALVPVALLRERVHLPLLAFASCLLLLAVWSHEGNAVLLPAFCAAMWVALRRAQVGVAPAAAVLAVIAAAGAAAVLWAVVHSRVDSYMDVCRPLLDRGLPERFCSGAIFWLERDLDQVFAVPDFASPPQREFILAYFLLLAGTVYAITQMTRPWLLAGLLVATGLPILPLYPIAIDWGRWMSLHFTSFAFLVGTLFLAGVVRQSRARMPRVTFLILAAALVMSVRHTTGLEFARWWTEVRAVATDLQG